MCSEHYGFSCWWTISIVPLKLVNTLWKLTVLSCRFSPCLPGCCFRERSRPSCLTCFKRFRQPQQRLNDNNKKNDSIQYHRNPRVPAPPPFGGLSKGLWTSAAPMQQPLKKNSYFLGKKTGHWGGWPGLLDSDDENLGTLGFSSSAPASLASFANWSFSWLMEKTWKKRWDFKNARFRYSRYNSTP